MAAHKVIGFHNPEEEYGFLSNWYPADFCLDGIFYSSLEQYMMYQKAVLFQDNEIADEILKVKDSAAVKALGRSVKNYEESIWNGRRQIIVYRGLIEKFQQNAGIKDALLATGDAILAECAVKDRIWGIGLSIKDKRRFDLKDIIETRATVRQTAKKFGISKSTVHTVVTK